MRPSRWNWLVAFMLLPSFAATAVAQTGIVAGKVTDKSEGRPIVSATVSLLGSGGRAVANTRTGNDGSYRLAGIATGTYTVQVIALGYTQGRQTGVVVRANATSTVDMVLEQSVFQLETITTTVSRAPEKTTEAPAQITVVPTVEITDRPSLSVTDHVKTLPGVDASQGGLVQSNVVGRGFNNIFSGALLMLIDNRFAAVPSLRVNVPAFFTATDQDIEKVEFVLGPGAALYGPNSSNGVLAITTKSPFESKGTTVSLETGYRSDSRDAAGNSLDNGNGLYRVGFRHASAGTKLGFKLSGEYLKGTEWKARDPAEPVSLPGRECGADFGCRNFNVERWNFDARLDWRPDEKTQVTGNFGYSDAVNLIEYTGIGAGQAQDWVYKYGQVRFRRGRLFVQGFGNFSDAGNESATDTKGTYLFRDGNPIVDKSRVWAAQIQHGFDVGKLGLTYGADYAYTDARTGNTINGRNEDIDNITEVGGYLYGVFRMASKVDLIGALRADKHSALADINWSPRAALVFKPTESQALRFTYNRAFSTPSNNNLFLDIVAGRIPLGGGLEYKVRALGVPESGFRFRDGACGAGGVDNLCMRTPFGGVFPGVPTDAFPTQASALWKVAIGAVTPGLVQAGVPASIMALLGAQSPTPAQVGTQLRTLDPSKGVFNNVTSAAVADIPDLRPTISNVFEIGYKGTWGDRFRIEATGWREKRENFVGPLIVESPNVFLDANTTAQYITGVLAAAQVPPAQIAALVPTLTCVLTGPKVTGCTQPGVPLGTVVPSSSLTNTSDVFLTYRNFGSVTLYGLDLSATYLIGNEWSLSGAYSHVNKDFFTKDEVDGPTDVALNAPKNKGAVALQYAQGLDGFAGEVRGRYVQGFPVNSGVYTTPLETGACESTNTCGRESINDYTLVDAAGSYRFKWGMVVSLSIQNVLNKNYQTFAGLPYLGRQILSRISYTF
jgi:outer membrane receptor for ferrienterochelin and colicins